MTENVTRSELAAHLEPIKADIAEIKTDVKAIRDQSWLGPRGRGVVNALVNGLLLLVSTTGLMLLIGRLG